MGREYLYYGLLLNDDCLMSGIEITFRDADAINHNAVNLKK